MMGVGGLEEMVRAIVIRLYIKLSTTILRCKRHVDGAGVVRAVTVHLRFIYGACTEEVRCRHVLCIEY